VAIKPEKTKNAGEETKKRATNKEKKETGGTRKSQAERLKKILGKTGRKGQNRGD